MHRLATALTICILTIYAHETACMQMVRMFSPLATRNSLFTKNMGKGKKYIQRFSNVKSHTYSNRTPPRSAAKQYQRIWEVSWSYRYLVDAAHDSRDLLSSKHLIIENMKMTRQSTVVVVHHPDILKSVCNLTVAIDKIRTLIKNARALNAGLDDDELACKSIKEINSTCEDVELFAKNLLFPSSEPSKNSTPTDLREKF